ncbi:MAG: clan AA aspartic protease [Myxococcales bacterium]|nr:clan AA aspartic protease [Myxococcales bacterium]
MGLTYVTVEVKHLSGRRRSFESQFLVDTGAIDCLAPASALRKVGLRVEGKNVYELANGTTVEYPYGHARIVFMGEETVSRIIFGPEGAEPILGVVALRAPASASTPSPGS